MNGQEKKEDAAIAAKPVLFVTEEYQNLYNLLQCRWLAIVSLYESKGQDLVFDQQTLEAILNWGGRSYTTHQRRRDQSRLVRCYEKSSFRHRVRARLAQG